MIPKKVMPMKSKKRFAEASALVVAALSAGIGTAAEVRQGHNSVIIKFTEPVVSTGVVENCWMEQLPAEDRGLNLFDITGDPAHTPTARWRDQDCLELTFVTGTATATKYRLSFRPGSDKYLSGKKMKTSSFEFSVKPKPLTSVGIMSGIPGGAVGVKSKTEITKEQLAFSVHSAVRYEFRQRISHSSGKFGKVVPATVTEMRVKNLEEYELHQYLNHPEKLGLSKDIKGLEAFSPELVVPGRVIVTPAEPLEKGKDWVLYCIAEENSGFVSGIVDGSFVPDTDLATGVSVYVERDAKQGDHMLASIAFESPVAEKDVEGIFRSMEIAHNGTLAVASEDGLSKVLTVGDRTITFRLLPLPENAVSAGAPQYLRKEGSDDAPTNVAYDLPYTDSFVMAIEGAESLPLTVDITIKKGTAALLGQPVTTDHCHRMTLAAAAPELSYLSTPDSPMLLPLKGEHKLRMESINNCSTELSVARLSVENFAQYRSALYRINEESVRSYAEINYLMQLTKKRLAAGLETEKYAKDQIKSYQRRLSQLKSSLPNYKALRAEMENVSFTEPRVLDTTGQGIGAVKAAEVLVDLDELQGGSAGPGLYLISVKTKADSNVRALLRELELDETLYDFEVWYAVQLTDLNFVEVGNAMMANRLSDGTPLSEGQLLNVTGSEPRVMAELKDGVVLTPASKSLLSGKQHVIFASGDDYRTVSRHYSSPRMNTDRRIMMVTDRSLYRPGETVNLRGVLREVSPLGVPSMPHVKSVELIVSRPNRKELMRKTLKLNEYGAYDFSFKLPEGDEDVVGTYRVTVQADGNKYRDEEFVECQVFRRDAFSAEGVLSMKKVRPEEFTYTLTAKDLNGVPLAGATAELEFDLSCYENTHHHHLNLPKEGEGAAPTPHLKDKQWKEVLTLDAQGKAVYTAKFDYLHRNNAMMGQGHLRVSGSVKNDREEYMNLNSTSSALYPADFMFRLNGLSDITLYSTTEDAEYEILNRDQSVSLRMFSQKDTINKLPNGIMVITPEPTLVWQGEVNVPANCFNGVPTGMYEVWKQNEKNFKEGAYVKVELRGKDASGLELVDWLTVRPWEIERPQRRQTESRMAKSTLSGRSIKVKSHFENEGKATVLVNSVAGIRPATAVEVKKGQNTWEIPLQDDEYGEVHVAVMLPVAEDGRYERLEYTTVPTDVERVDTKLAVQLTMPQQSPAPGAEITLSGHIVGPDGKPVPDAEVTLFAVDKGMLSVSGGHRIDNPGTYFTKVWVSGMYPQFSSIPAPVIYHKHEKQILSLMDGIWQGDIVGEGEKCYSSSHRRPMMMARAGSGAVKTLGAVMPQADCVEEAVCVEAECDDEFGDGTLGDGLGAAPMAAESASWDMARPALARNAVSYKKRAANTTVEGEIPPWLLEEEEEGADVPTPRLRTNFVPVAVWAPALATNAEGNFSVNVTLPDTLTTYQVYAVALGKDGKQFGYAESEFTVNQPVMITPGTPLFMSTGDRLRLPLTITNNTEAEGTWTVQLEGAEAPQQIVLQAKTTSTLYFDYTAVEEGERKLRWEARSTAGSDAVEGSFEVKFPAPVLREAHRLVLNEGGETVQVGKLPAPELASSTRGKVEIELSANPLLHLNECMELTLSRGYGNTEWYATSLLPWMLHERMAPFSPVMASVPAAEARETVLKGIDRLVKCQVSDGGMSYWPSSSFCSNQMSSPWASAYAGLVLTIAQDNGFAVPENTMSRLREYLAAYLKEMREKEKEWKAMSPHILYAIARTLEDDSLITEALNRALAQQTERDGGDDILLGVYHPRFCYYSWFRSHRSAASLNFLAEMHQDNEARHASFLKWMRVVGHDYRHATTWDGGWMLIALHEYLRLTPAGNPNSTVTLENGQQLTLGNGPTAYTPATTPTLGEIATTITPTSGTTYVNVKFKAQPEQTEYPGVVEKGLQVTRMYEKRGDDGAWRPCTEFNVGDVVRVTLTCAKAEKDLEYFVLEDYLPSNMEAINPEITSQSAGLEWTPWSSWFDNREFQAHRVRGFCTRWAGRDLLNMSYYARVKRAGEAMAPPASAQLMYEPQTYGLSPNTKVISK